MRVVREAMGAADGSDSLLQVSATVAVNSVIAFGGIDWPNGDGETTNRVWRP